MTAMKTIKQLLQINKPTFSIELFPPKTDDGYTNLKNTITAMVQLNPDFFTCTYGAGGGNRDRTLDIVTHIQKNHAIPAVHHLTCVLHTKDDIKNILTQMNDEGVDHVLALRGDPPQNNPNWQAGPSNFQYSYELCDFIKEHFGNQFTIGVAGFPEGHLLAPNKEKDAEYLKSKVDHGADFVITQLFFNNQDYFDYVDRLKKINVNIPIIPGIIPITSYPGLLKFCDICGASIPKEVHTIFKPIADDKEKTIQAGIDFCVKQCRDLLDNGAPGIHFYALNKIEPLRTILKQIR